MDIVNLIVTLLSGVAGGNLAGVALKEKSLGPVGNSLSGLVGGGVGDFLLKAAGILASSGLGAAMGADATGATSGLDIGSLLGSIAGSGASGAILTTVIALIKNASQK